MTEEMTIAEERKEARELSVAMEEILECKGWPKLREFVEAQIRQREVAVVYGDDNHFIESGIKRERISGEAAGLRLVLDFPEMLLADSKETIIKIDELENHDE